MIKGHIKCLFLNRMIIKFKLLFIYDISRIDEY